MRGAGFEPAKQYVLGPKPSAFDQAWQPPQGCVPATSLLLIKKTKPVLCVDEAALARKRMLDEQLRSRDIEDERVLEAMQSVPRHVFVPEGIRASAHMDNPLPIGHDQTISQPYIVALMTQLLAKKVPVGGRILEIGSGSGYQTAILVSMGFEVHCIEVVPELVEPSRKVLSSIGLKPESMNVGDGHLGMPDKAPYDGILAAACARKLPKEWRKQLKDGGVIVAPVKRSSGQYLFRWTKQGRALKRENIIPVRFVPLIKS